MKFKFILLSIFASFLAGIIYSSNAFATNIPPDVFSKPIPVCDEFPDFISVMKNDLNVTVDDNLAYVGFKDSNYYRYAYSTFKPTSSYPRSPIRLIDENGKYVLEINNSISYRYPTMWKSESTYSKGSRFSDPSFNCFSSYQNMTFHYCRSNTCHKINEADYSKIANLKSFTNSKSSSEYEGFTSSIFEEFRECQAFDLGCLVENFLIFIRNIFAFILNLPKIITEIFNQFFNDNKDLFSNAFTDLNDNMRKKLGFLTFPFDFLGKLYQSISFSADYMHERHCYWGRKAPYSDPTNWTGIPTCPEICAEKILGDASICINFGELERRMPEIWAVGINILRFGVLISLIEILRRKYLSVVRG